MTTRNKLNLLFIIKRAKVLKNGEVPVYVRITVNGKATDAATGLSIREECWNPGTNCAVGKTKEVRQLNAILDKIKTAVYENYRQLLDEGKVITAKSVKNAWQGKDDDVKTIIGIFSEHNAHVKLLSGKDFAPATVQRYETSMKHVKDYIKRDYNEDDLPVYKITPEFIKGLELYLKTERNCGHNSAIKYIKNFKKIVRIACANGWLRVDPFANVKFTLKKVDRGFLSEEELDTIMKKEFDTDRLTNVRDIFVFGCFTGLAYSDLKQLKAEHIVLDSDGRPWIHTKRKKTENSCHIPLLPAAQTIIEKYKNHPHCLEKKVLLPVLSNQKLNSYLKEISTLCSINKEITTHLARHTFATTVTLNNDIPIESVSKMLGHSSIKMTQVYARLLDKKVSKDMSKLYDKY